MHEEKDSLDWTERFEKLRTIVNSYKSQKNYDCIVPVSGGRDSYFIVYIVKEVLGLNPLLVTYNQHYNTDIGIRNLANLRIQFDCDIYTMTVNPSVVKRVTRSTIRQFGSLYWHCLAGQTVYPVQVAAKYKIPLIIWGAHQGVDQVGMYSHLDEVEMTRKYRKEHDLMGYEAEDLINDVDDITLDDVAPYVYPDDEEIESVGIRGIYLNNYIRWDSKAQHELMIDKYGYETNCQNRTFDKYNDVDSFVYSDLHDYIKYLKHGFGKVVDHACREIRLKRMTREQGVNLAIQYSAKLPVYDHLFASWLGVDADSLHFILEQFRNTIYWKKIDGKWNNTLLSSYLGDSKFKELVDMNRLPNIGEDGDVFRLTEAKRKDYSDDKYVLFGKGWFS